MKSSMLFALASLLAMPPALGQDARKIICGDTDKACAEKAMGNHAAGKIGTWQTTLSRPVGERIGPAPPELVEYINLDNIVNDIAERPRSAKLSADLLADVMGAIADLPPKVWSLFGKRLVGLYFVEGLGGTGYTDYVFDTSGKAVAAFVVFDASVLTKQSANAWAKP